MMERLIAFGERAWTRRALLGVSIVLFGAWSSRALTDHKVAIDFYVYYLAAEGFAQGKDVYFISTRDWDVLAAEQNVPTYTWPYYYPPLTAQLVWPLTALAPRWAALLWLLASSAAFIASAWLLGRSSTSSIGVPLALGLTLGFAPFLDTLNTGQVNGFLLLALCTAFFGLSQARWPLVGAALSVGFLLKLLPLAHLGYLFWRRQWKSLGVSFAVISLLVALAVPLIGWPAFFSYPATVLQAFERVGGLWTSGANQALTGLIGRIAGGSISGLFLWWVSVAALIASTAALCWPRGPIRDDFDLEFGLVTTAVNLVMPYTWYHQLVLLVIPMFVLVRRSLTQAAPRWILIPVGVGYVLTSLHRWTWYRLAPDNPLVSIPPAFMLFLWVLLAWLIVNRNTARDADFRT